MEQDKPQPRYVLKRLFDDQNLQQFQNEELIELKPGILKIGRVCSLNNFRDSDYISRNHCELHLRPDGQLSVKDTGSMNGTYIQGELLIPHTDIPLYPEDILGFGQSEPGNSDAHVYRFEVSEVSCDVSGKLEGGTVQAKKETLVADLTEEDSNDEKENSFKCNISGNDGQVEKYDLVNKNKKITENKRSAESINPHIPAKVSKYSEDSSKMDQVRDEFSLTDADIISKPANCCVLYRKAQPNDITDLIVLDVTNSKATEVAESEGSKPNIKSVESDLSAENGREKFKPSECPIPDGTCSVVQNRMNRKRRKESTDQSPLNSNSNNVDTSTVSSDDSQKSSLLDATLKNRNSERIHSSMSVNTFSKNKVLVDKAASKSGSNNNNHIHDHSRKRCKISHENINTIEQLVDGGRKRKDGVGNSDENARFTVAINNEVLNLTLGDSKSVSSSVGGQKILAVEVSAGSGFSTTVSSEIRNSSNRSCSSRKNSSDKEITEDEKNKKESGSTKDMCKASSIAFENTSENEISKDNECNRKGSNGRTTVSAKRGNSSTRSSFHDKEISEDEGEKNKKESGTTKDKCKASLIANENTSENRISKDIECNRKGSNGRTTVSAKRGNSSTRSSFHDKEISEDEGEKNKKESGSTKDNCKASLIANENTSENGISKDIECNRKGSNGRTTVSAKRRNSPTRNSGRNSFDKEISEDEGEKNKKESGSTKDKCKASFIANENTFENGISKNNECNRKRFRTTLSAKRRNSSTRSSGRNSVDLESSEDEGEKNKNEMRADMSNGIATKNFSSSGKNIKESARESSPILTSSSIKDSRKVSGEKKSDSSRSKSKDYNDWLVEDDDDLFCKIVSDRLNLDPHSSSTNKEGCRDGNDRTSAEEVFEEALDSDNEEEYSQHNYTMEDTICEEDDDSEDFPCSQIFDVSVCKENSDKASDREFKKPDDDGDDVDDKGGVDDEVVIISDDDDYDHPDEDDEGWFTKLSQTFDDEQVNPDQENIDVPVPVCIKDDPDEITGDVNVEEGLNIGKEKLISVEKSSKEKLSEKEEYGYEILDIAVGDILEEVKQIELAERKMQPKAGKRTTATKTGPKCKPVEALTIGPKKNSTRRNSRLKKQDSSSSKFDLSNSQKELRKEKLKAIAGKSNGLNCDSRLSNKTLPTVHVKMTSINRSDNLVNTLLNNNNKNLPAPAVNKHKSYRIPKVADKSKTDIKETKKEEHCENSKTEVDETKNLENTKLTLRLQRLTVSSSSTVVSPNNKTTFNVVGTNERKHKKLVSFSDEVSIKEIEALPGTTKYEVNPQSVKRADQALIKIQPLPGPEYTLDEVYFYILHWNFQWLEEQKKFKAAQNIQPPPVYSNKPVKATKNEYDSFIEYYEHLVPLLLLEMWARISRDYDNVRENQKVYFLKIDSKSERRCLNCIMPDSRSDRTILMINCHMYMMDEEVRFKKHPKVGDFGVVELRFQEKNSAKYFNLTVFCYVSSTDLSWANRHCQQMDKNLIEQSNYSPNDLGLRQLNLVLLVKGLKNGILREQFTVRMKLFSYIRPQLKHFESLMYLHKSQLMPAILKPSMFDFKVDDLHQQIKRPQGCLNSAQESAIMTGTKLCLGQKPNIGVIHGPPGTGKSHVIVNLIKHIMNESSMFTEKPQILFCAPTNNAVDQVVSRLIEVRRSLPAGKRFNLIRTGQVNPKNSLVASVMPESLAEKHFKECNEDTRDPFSTRLEIDLLMAKKNSLLLQKEATKEEDRKRFDEKLKTVNEELSYLNLDTVPKNLNSEKHRRERMREAIKALIKGAHIIATTLSSSTTDQLMNALTDNGERPASVTCCIIDEAAQCTETELLIPLNLNIGKMILVGDPLQLRATVISDVARLKGFGNSLFSRIYSIWESGNKGRYSPITFLDTQYRMNPSISNWPAQYVYKNKLKNGYNFDKFYEVAPYTLIDHNFTQHRSGNEMNYSEGELVVHLTFSILKMNGCENMRVGIITPYVTQKNLILNMLKERSENHSRLLANIEVNSIDGFQGQERDIIIVSCVRSEGTGFMSDLQRVNVTFTRAQHALLVCANFKAFCKNNIWYSLYENAKKRKKVLCINSAETSELNKLTETMKQPKRLVKKT